MKTATPIAVTSPQMLHCTGTLTQKKGCRPTVNLPISKEDVLSDLYIVSDAIDHFLTWADNPASSAESRSHFFVDTKNAANILAYICKALIEKAYPEPKKGASK